MLDPSDAVCPICLDVYIEPVTLCCKHELCKPCYDEHFQKADFRCPICKKRLSVWARKAAQSGSLVNVAKWEKIQEQFADLVEKRNQGEDTYRMLILPAATKIATPGEVHDEYIKLRKDWELENQAEVNQQEDASMALIQQILLEEKQEIERERQKQLKADEELATVISSQLNRSISPDEVNNKLLRSHTTNIKKTPQSKKRKISPNSLEKYFSSSKKSKSLEDKKSIGSFVSKRLRLQEDQGESSQTCISSQYLGADRKENISPDTGLQSDDDKAAKTHLAVKSNDSSLNVSSGLHDNNS